MTNANRYQEWDTAERDKTYWRIHCPSAESPSKAKTSGH